MVNPDNAQGDALLEQVIEHLRQQEIPDFPDPEITVRENAKKMTSSDRPISPLWRMVMDRRWQLSAGAMVGLAALLGFLLLWGGDMARPASAMERMAEAVRKAKSYKYTSNVKGWFTEKPGGPRSTTETSTTKYWLAPDSLRLDYTLLGDKWKGPGPEMSNIAPGLNKWKINIDNSAKTFRRMPPNGRRYFSPLDRLDSFGSFSGKADRELGSKKINGREALGFVIAAQKIDPFHPLETMEIWIDRQTNLPLFIHCVSETENGSIVEDISNIQWNIDLDPKLFDLTPPPGYTDVTPKDVVGYLLQGLRARPRLPIHRRLFIGQDGLAHGTGHFRSAKSSQRFRQGRAGYGRMVLGTTGPGGQGCPPRSAKSVERRGPKRPLRGRRCSEEH